ncbi:MAG: pirin family protein [Saprospiraceae bacterium]|nr:pirin family protein [Saprospiraceae bacterium]
MKSVIHKANTRGHADHGWLNTHHTFSFGNYHRSDRMNFGVLRVLNDDVVAPAMGFGTHPHANMEIISIPLEGDLRHRDSMGNTVVIRTGDVQVMSAGSGIRHSEINANSDQEVKFLQIWVYPNQENVEPRYDQISVDPSQLQNRLYQILSPSAVDQGVWIHQNAWFYLGNLDDGYTEVYHLHEPTNGVYFFVIEGEVMVEDQKLELRDGIGIWDVDQIKIETQNSVKVLIMEIPML